MLWLKSEEFVVTTGHLTLYARCWLKRRRYIRARLHRFICIYVTLVNSIYIWIYIYIFIYLIGPE